MAFEAYIYTIVILTAIILLFFNFLSLFVLLVTPKLRHRVSNIPVISFLIGSALQGAIPAPFYIYKILAHRSGNEPGWICDVYRFQYIFCTHIMEVSIMILAFERLCAVRFPFRYPALLTRRNLSAVLGIAWITTSIIDLLPFLNPKDVAGDHCTYIPTATWGLCVIIVYNITPCITVFVCYGVIWRTAYRFALTDRKRSESLRFTQQCNLIDKDDTTGGGGNFNKETLSPKHSYQKSLKFTLEIKATKTSLAIVAVFLICWLPMGIFYMADHFCHNCISDNEEIKHARRAVKLLAFSSSLLTPLVYCWWNKEFREQARIVFRGKKHSHQMIDNV